MERVFVDCNAATGTFKQFVANIRNDPAWKFHELTCGHDAMVTDPHGVARVLLAV